MRYKFPHDDDWGDYQHELRKQKALDKRWDEEAERLDPNAPIEGYPPGHYKAWRDIPDVEGE